MINLSDFKKITKMSVVVLGLISFSNTAVADNCENNVASAQTQGIENLLRRPQHKTTLNSTANEVRQNVNNGQVPIVNSESQQNIGHFTITNLCSADANEENFWECTYKKVVVKQGALPSSDPFRHSKEVKYRIGNIRASANSKCTADFSIVQSSEKHGSDD